MPKTFMQLPAKSAIRYPIDIQFNILSQPNQWLPNDWRSRNIVIITDDVVKEYYVNTFIDVLKEVNPLVISFSSGEQSKNQQVKTNIETQMLAAHCARNTLIIALGGGVVGDMAGFIAATYMRGIDYIQIPTTLLAMVDSSVGGKTGINTPQGKNLIGAFWQPTGVVVDVNCLKTLPMNYVINGLFEALKMFITHDATSFYYVSDCIDAVLDKDLTVLSTIVVKAIAIKVAIVSGDEKENHQRMFLNFGHTIGHALEKVTGYTMLHGYAVAVGMLVEMRISILLGILSETDYHKVSTLLLRLGAVEHSLKNININELICATQMDKKIKNEQVRYVLLRTVGNVFQENNAFVHPVDDDIVKQALLDVMGI